MDGVGSSRRITRFFINLIYLLYNLLRVNEVLCLYYLEHRFLKIKVSALHDCKRISALRFAP